MAIVKYTIDEEGNISLEVVGTVRGKACLLVTRELEKLLGGETSKRVLKKEYYEPPFPPLTSSHKKKVEQK